MRMISDYAKAWWKIVISPFLLVGGIVLFLVLVLTVPSTPFPLLGMFMGFTGGTMMAVSSLFSQGMAEHMLVRAKYSDGPKVEARNDIRDLKELRKDLVRSYGSDPNDNTYRRICKVEAEIAAAKGKPYKYPKYQPGKDSDW